MSAANHHVILLQFVRVMAAVRRRKPVGWAQKWAISRKSQFRE
jgi:hypothetical protein